MISINSPMLFMLNYDVQIKAKGNFSLQISLKYVNGLGKDFYFC